MRSGFVEILKRHQCIDHAVQPGGAEPAPGRQVHAVQHPRQIALETSTSIGQEDPSRPRVGRVRVRRKRALTLDASHVYQPLASG